MDAGIYIIFKDGIPFELVRGDYSFRLERLNTWIEMFPEFTYSISDVRLWGIYDQYNSTNQSLM